MHWCYIDESWREGGAEKIGVLAATVGSDNDFENLDNKMYQVRRKYLGDDNARDKTSEIKGSQIFSNYSFKQQQRHQFSKNLALAREVLEFVKTTTICYVGVTVYGSQQPSLLAPRAKDLARPFKELCNRLKLAIPDKERGLMVFDQRVGAQEGISVAISNYLAGMDDDKALHPHPLVGVSNIHAGLQLADMAAFVLGKWADGDERFLKYYKFLSYSQLQAKNEKGKKRYGLVRLQHNGGEQFSIRKERIRK